jgi:adenylate cyclase class 2
VTKFTETELKLYVPDLAAVARRLDDVGARLIAQRIHEENVRYDDSAMTLSAARRVLRLRRDTRIRLTYKDERGERTKDDATSRFEAEVEVSDFDAMQAILEKLGYHAFMIYEKYRTTYELDGAEVTLDEMPYGNFVEIEGEEDSIRNMLERLHLSEAPRFTEGYITLFEYVKRHLGLDFQDLTFDNFQRIEVPLRAFES